MNTVNKQCWLGCILEDCRLRISQGLTGLKLGDKNCMHRYADCKKMTLRFVQNRHFQFGVFFHFIAGDDTRNYKKYLAIGEAYLHDEEIAWSRSAIGYLLLNPDSFYTNP